MVAEQTLSPPHHVSIDGIDWIPCLRGYTPPGTTTSHQNLLSTARDQLPVLFAAFVEKVLAPGRNHGTTIPYRFRIPRRRLRTTLQDVFACVGELSLLLPVVVVKLSSYQI